MFWALQDISFDIQQGDVVGIIGKNGAGKSTLLKVLSQITAPTKGRVEIEGRVASLLEVGTGFHPELTGRENIFLNGTILGMSRKEVKSKLDQIIEFAGVEKFIDTPVKHYSSGMYVRLAFSVAAHLEPEILIIDEVLAVGDAEFQKKCLGKMQDVSTEGRTVLFVSHNMLAVQSLCNKGVLLEKGKATVYQDVGEAISRYMTDTTDETSKSWKGDDRPGNENTRLEVVELTPSAGNRIAINTGIDFRVLFENHVEGVSIDLTLEVVNEQGITVFHVGTEVTAERSSEQKRYEVTTSIPPDFLNAGRYTINMIFGENARRPLFITNGILSFEVENYSETSNMARVPGVVKPALQWSVNSFK